MFFRKKQKVKPDYYILKYATDNVKDYTIYGEVVPENIKYKYCWTSGEPFLVEMPSPIIYIQDKKEELSKDFLFTSTNQFLISDRFFNIVKRMSTCARGYVAHIYYDDVLVSDKYYAVNFEKAWACMNLKKSKYTKSPNLDYILRVTRLVLNEEEVPNSEEIFLLKEFAFMIATNRFKEIVESNQITGVRFIDFRDQYLI
jgi:hypothetical protein